MAEAARQVAFGTVAAAADVAVGVTDAVAVDPQRPSRRQLAVAAAQDALPRPAEADVAAHQADLATAGMWAAGMDDPEVKKGQLREEAHAGRIGADWEGTACGADKVGRVGMGYHAEKKESLGDRDENGHHRHHRDPDEKEEHCAGKNPVGGKGLWERLLEGRRTPRREAGRLSWQDQSRQDWRPEMEFKSL